MTAPTKNSPCSPVSNPVSRPSPLARRRFRRGFSLPEVLTAVTVTGVLASVAISSFNNRIGSARSVEAVNMLAAVQRGVLAANDELWAEGAGETMALGQKVKGFGTFGLPTGLFNNGNGNGSNNDGGIDGDGNNGHGNNDDGCDPDNPASCDGEEEETDSDSDSGNNGNGSDKDGGIDGDGNSGHGNNDDGCDPDNPGNGGNCDGDSDGGGADDDMGPSYEGSAADERVCGSSTAVPADFAAVQGQRYAASPSEWSTGDSKNGWTCLRVSGPNAPISYQFGYDRGSSRIGPSTGTLPEGVEESEAFTAWARGDVDGDGRNSWFVLSGAVIDGQAFVAPSIEIIDENE